MAEDVTLDDFLRFHPPALTQIRDFPSSHTRCVTPIEPRSVTIWPRFCNAVADAPADSLIADYPHPNPTSGTCELNTGCEQSVHGYFHVFVGQAIQRCCIPLHRVRQGDWGAQRVFIGGCSDLASVVGDPDLALALMDVLQAEYPTLSRVLVLIEMKTEGTLPLISATDIVALGSLSPQHWAAISQLHAYMQWNDCMYGVLSTYSGSYFLRARGYEELQIAGPILLRQDNPTLLRCFFYILRLGLEDSGYPSEPPAPSKSLRVTRSVKRVPGEGSSDQQSSGREGRGKCTLNKSILQSSIIHDAAAKDYGIKLMKITELDFDLPKAYTRTMCKEFEVLEYGDMPKMLVRLSHIYGCMLHTRRVHISKDEIAIMKFHEGIELDVRKLVKEVCVYKHLEKLQGYRIPELLLYGVPGTLKPNIIIGLPRFFFIVKFYGEVLGPSEVSAPELGQLLDDIHGHGILLGCREFPRVTHNGSALMLVDMATAVFDKNKDRLKKEFQYLTSLCKGE